MARLLRIQRADAWYHLTARGNEQRSIYRDDRDRRHFLELLPGCLERFRARLHAYVLMDNHYHLLLELFRSGTVRIDSARTGSAGERAQRDGREHGAEASEQPLGEEQNSGGLAAGGQENASK